MARRIPTPGRKDHGRFLSRLANAFFELTLIILLYLHALLSLMVHRLARCCKLPSPCLLCARLDPKPPHFFKELLCKSHKLEVASLVYCRPHRRLATAGEMCDTCLLHSAGKIERDTAKILLPSRPQSKMRCSCCSAVLTDKPNTGLANAVLGANNVKDELLCRCLQAGSSASEAKSFNQVVSADMVPEKLIHLCSSDAEASVAERRFEMSDTQSITSNGNGLDESSWSQRNRSLSPEIGIKRVLTDSVTKLDVLERSSFTSAGDAIKALSSNDAILRTNQGVNEKLSGVNVPFPSPATPEIAIGKEPSRASDDLMVRFSQISSSRWLDFPMNEACPSPRTIAQFDESKLSEASSYIKRFTSERYDPGMDFSEGSIESEIEGETPLDRLKRQSEMDRKAMSILYKELEEERNASAIAANQAMAMITRLQEEKAAMQMEALQYLRMMEEQAEYDQEALQKLNDLLCDRDKDVQDLEAILESYRKQFGDIVESPFDFEGREGVNYTPVSTPRFMRMRGREVGSFEDEKAFILDSLRRLEVKLKLYSQSGPYAENLVENCEDSNDAVDNDEKLSQRSERESSTPRHAIQFSIREALKESRFRSNSTNERQLQMGSKKNDVVSIGNEISQLTARLEALEEDRSFIEHAVSSLRHGSNGIQFVQEIVCHLRELRKFGSLNEDTVVA